MTLPQVDLRIILPEITVGVAVAVVMVWAAFLPQDRQRLLRWVSGIALLLALLEVFVVSGGAAFGGMYVRDTLTKSLQIIVLLTAILAVWMSGAYLERTRLETGEYYALLLSAALGALLMAASTDLLLLFLGLETLSIPLYVLAAIARGDLRSQEAGMKYFLLGAFSTVFFLYGLALIFGAAGSTSLARVASAAGTGSPLLLAGIGLVTIGLAFKAAVVPFHAWAPDVYEGAPLPVAAYMSVIAKVGAFAAMIRVFVLALPGGVVPWGTALAVLSMMTMTLGNVAALLQSNLKRLLAYSSIAHAGFMLTGIIAANRAGTSAVVFYLLVYTLMTLGAFGVLLGLVRRGEEADDISDLTGLAWRSPALAGAMTLFMVSLAGLPPTAGFFAKLYVFSAVLDAGYVAVVIVAVLTSVVSAYYYLRVAYTMFIGQPSPEVEFVGGRWVSTAIIVTAAGVLLLGIIPAPVTTFLEQVADALK
ncbi:MAG: NADH-quinone oxidoreductase subunit N [bacterium]